MHIEWWHWIIAGFCMIGLELIIPSFTIIWFGMGALVVGILKAVWPGFPLTGQLILWSLASIAFTIMWFKYLKPNKNQTGAGQSKEGIVGESGIVIRGTANSYEKGVVRFRISILGADEWTCYSDDTLQIGDNVRVVDIEGQILKVAKL
ncbi:MAG TPA: NfeD family protein [Deltaproteobacteria bacterium]|nr:NfeD family protein [Deltaproteobacteria bacterium]HQB38606.1 NfeD family protein [Deltaproteobacteria bacterium]